ncbi:MAG: alpha-N-acetylglucosaminidase [Marinifilaceae bacterium]
MTKRAVIITAIIMCFINQFAFAGAVEDLLERIDKGASKKFKIELQKKNTEKEFFELDQSGNKVVVRGNTLSAITSGIHWYLKYHAGIMLGWNGMQAELPSVLPPVKQKERHETSYSERYNFNYCTFSYTMAFWDWERWEKEIDWMALHGITTPLALTGTETVWKNVLEKLGYSRAEVDDFIAGPGFQAWWLMNNLEGWGGPNPDSWYQQQAELQQKIVKRMRQLGIEPVFAGYAGMVPNNAKEKLNLDVTDPGKWCGYRRPAFLQPSDERFAEIADLYYSEMTKLFGKAKYYAIDPFHEGGSTAGVNLDEAGKAFMAAMKRCNPQAKWVIQAWQANPRAQMIDNLSKGDLIVLDLASEARPQWGDPKSTWYRKEGYGKHDWLYCMLLNFGGNVGLHGKMQHVINSFYSAASHEKASTTLKGIGLTYEGSENNTVMYELLTELPWRNKSFTKEEWLKQYVFARYGKHDAKLEQAWNMLANSIYNCSPQSVQQGTNESVFCMRPHENGFNASSWAWCEQYYSAYDVIEAARLMLSVADNYKGNNNFEYDLVDVVRQAIAEEGRLRYQQMGSALKTRDVKRYEEAANDFLTALLAQDKLLSTRPEFMVGSWIEQAKKIAKNDAAAKLLEWNARVQITTWGDRHAANNGGLHDYAHREWSGLLKDFYYTRWKTYIDYNIANINKLDILKANSQKENKPVTPADEQNIFKTGSIDYYAIEEPWTLQRNLYPSTAQADVVETTKKLFYELFD